MTAKKQMLSSVRVRETFRRIPVTYRFCVIIVVAVLAVVLFGMSPFSAKLLVVAPSKFKADFSFIADFGCGQCYRRAADRSNSAAAEQVLLCAEAPKRLVSLGAILPIEELARQKLLNDGISADAIQTIKGSSRSDWDTARLLDAWLKEHPESRVRVLCDLFFSRRWAFILDRTLAKSNRARVMVEGVTDPRYNEANWWRRRTGLKTYFFSLFRLAYSRWHGEDLAKPIDWSADKYESTVFKSRR